MCHWPRHVTGPTISNHPLGVRLGCKLDYNMSEGKIKRQIMITQGRDLIWCHCKLTPTHTHRAWVVQCLLAERAERAQGQRCAMPKSPLASGSIPQLMQHMPAWKMDKQNAVYMYNGILYSNEREWTTNTHNVDVPLARWKKSTEKTTYFMVPFTWNVQEHSKFGKRHSLEMKMEMQTEFKWVQGSFWGDEDF